jgi:uncharacterized protein
MELIMRAIALEEHVQFSFVKEQIDKTSRKTRDSSPRSIGNEALLADVGAGRIAAMDAAGISLQVLSSSPPGADILDGEDGILLASAINDRLSEAVRAHPDRFLAFAHLPMRTPEAAANELERRVSEQGFCGAMINGMTDDLFLDNARFAPLLARAQQLDVPLYLHPNTPPAAVRNVYFENLPGRFGNLLAAGAWGWHSETAIHVLRLAFSGTFDRHPRLKLIIGHMGEMLPMMLARIEEMSQADVGQSRSTRKTIIDHVHITTSGIFTQAPFLAALMTFGVDRIMFGVDYPYSANEKGRAFLDALVVSETDKGKIAHRNAELLLKLSPSTP